MRNKAVLMTGLCAVMLTGCGQHENAGSFAFNSFIEERIMNDSAIQEDESYVRYETISQEQVINEDGYFYSDEVDYSVLEDEDAVHVTFAENSYITVQYFDDPSMTNLLDQGGVYLHANDCIYANIQEIDNPNTAAYQFGGFEIWEFDENGVKKKEIETAASEDGKVFQIPMDYQGKELSIVPLGEYTMRKLYLTDYYLDSNQVERELAGTWDVNGDETTGEEMSINPVASYTVTYHYDPESFIFVGSEPSYLYHDEAEGIVHFEEYASEDDLEKFSVELQEKTTDQMFDPKNYQVEHADMVYKYQGVMIDRPISIPAGTKIAYEISRVDNGYWIAGDAEGEVAIEDVSELISGLVCKDESVTVFLPQPEQGGTIIYTMDGKTLSGDRVEARIGAEIRMDFQCKSGWSCNTKDGAVYKVVDMEEQKAVVNGTDVNTIFTEAEYKPVVTLTIDKSVGTTTEFELSSADGTVSALKLEEEKTAEVFSEELGTQDDLILNASKGALLDGEALKVEIETKMLTGDQKTDIRYLQKLPDALEVKLYISNRARVYSSINITVSKVDVVAFSSPSIDNGLLTVMTTDLSENRFVRAGEVIEGSRKVSITLSAKSGYYIKGSGKEGVYSKVMKYSTYESDIASILEKYSIQKLCEVTLDTTDAYGTVTYQIDGKAVEGGTYLLREDQKLEIAYEITDGVHEIMRDDSAWYQSAWNLTKSKTKETVEVLIIPSLDGTTLTREQYIDVQEQ